MAHLPVVIGGNGIGGIPGIDIGGNDEKLGIFAKFDKPDGGAIPENKFEPCHEKTNILDKLKQRRKSASQ